MALLQPLMDLDSPAVLPRSSSGQAEAGPHPCAGSTPARPTSQREQTHSYSKCGRMLNRAPPTALVSSYIPGLTPACVGHMIHWLSFSQTRERVRRPVSINGGGTDHMKVRTRFWIEAGLASLTTLLLLLTLVRRDWIEAMFGIDPDNYSG